MKHCSAPVLPKAIHCATEFVESKNLFRTRNSKRVARVTQDARARAMPPVL